MFCPNDTILYNKAPAFALIRPHAIPSRETNTTFCRLLLFKIGRAPPLGYGDVARPALRRAYCHLGPQRSMPQAWQMTASGRLVPRLPRRLTPLCQSSLTTMMGKIATISRALSGEGWACAGQTDMEMPMGLFFMSAQCRKTMKSS